MSELTLAQRERIERITRYRAARLNGHAKATPRRLDGIQNLLLVGLAFTVALLIIVGWAMALEWSPGRQAEIHADYKAQRHAAAEWVRVQEEEKPSVEIVAR